MTETDDGYHLPVITVKRDFPDACAAFLKVTASRPVSRPLELRLSPVRIAVLRTLFELQESTRILAGEDAAKLAGFPAKEIMTHYASPRLLSLIEVLPDSAQWDVQALAGNEMLLAIELTALRQHRLLTRDVVGGTPVYRLSPDGLTVAREVFAARRSVNTPSSRHRGLSRPAGMDSNRAPASRFCWVSWESCCS